MVAEKGLIEIKVLPESALPFRQPTDNMNRPALLLFQGKILHNSEDRRSKDVLLKFLASCIKVRWRDAPLALWDLVLSGL